MIPLKRPTAQGRSGGGVVVDVEALEPRRLLSATTNNGAILDLNISRMLGGQQEGTIAINPTNPNNLFASANNLNGPGLFAGVSMDGGASWNGRLIGAGSDGLVSACCDSMARFDRFGDLFVSYLAEPTNSIQIVMSRDGGQTFTRLANFGGDVDRPALAVGPSSIWVTFLQGSDVVVSGATIRGPGDVGSFSALQTLTTSSTDNIRGLAVAPGGQVLLAYPRPVGNVSQIVVQVDPDGTGNNPFGPPIVVGSTNVGESDAIPPQSVRTIDSAVNLAFDTSNGPFRGRVYLIYTDEFPRASGNTNIMLRFSDNNGATWSAATKLNDDTTVNSQFFPDIAVDPATGFVAASWYDARNDHGIPGQGSVDTTVNNDVQFWGAFGTPTAAGVSFKPNFQISAGTSSATSTQDQNEFGDYTGIDFVNGRFYPVWADNSNSTGDNPNGALGALNLYTAAVPADFTPPSAALSIAPAVTTAGGATADITITYSDDVALDPSTLNAGDIRVSRGGLVLSVANISVATAGQTKVVTYTLSAPGGTWDVADDGIYAVEVLGGQVRDWIGNANPGGVLGTFAVGITPPPVIVAPATAHSILVAPDRGGGPNIRIFDAAGNLLQSYFAYDVNYLGGVRVALGDINGDGTPDVITAPEAGAPSNVRVFNGIDGQPLPGPLGSFLAFDPGFLGGLYLAAGDVNGDGKSDIIVGADAGAGPNVVIFDGATGQPFRSFFAYDPAFLGGVRVAAGDVTGDGRADIITGSGSATPHVRIFNGLTSAMIASFFAYDPGFQQGIFVAAGDVNGDGRADVITGTGVGPPHIKAFNIIDFFNPPILASFFAYDTRFQGGVRVAAGDINGDGAAEILTGSGPGAAHVRAFTAAGTAVASFFAYDGFNAGIYIAGTA